MAPIIKYENDPTKGSAIGQMETLAAENPNTIIQGAKTGETAGGIPAKDITSQVLFQDNPASRGLKLPEPPSSFSLDSGYANDYISSKTSELQQQADSIKTLLGGNIASGAQPTGVDGEYRVGGYTFNVNSDPSLKSLLDNPYLQENQARIAVQQGVNRRDVEARTRTSKERLDEQQKQGLATTKASEFRSERTGTGNPAESILAKVEDEHIRQRDDFSRRVNDLINEANDNFLKGFFGRAEKLQKVLNEDIPKAIKQEEEDYLARVEKLQDIQSKMQSYDEKAAKMGADNRVNASKIIGDYAKAGTPLTEETAQALADNYGIDVQDAVNMYQVAQDEYQLDVAGKAEDVITKRRNNMKTYLDIADRVGAAVPIDIGDSTYTYQGYDDGGFQTGTEQNKQTGETVFWKVNKKTGEVNTTSLGNFGTTGWSTEQDDAGNLWRVNPNTGQTELMTPGQGRQDASNVIPPGSVSPFGPDRVQCGAFVNDCTGAGVGDTFESKMAKTDQSIKAGSDNPPRYGDFFVQELNTWTGHTGMVLGYKEKDGKGYIETVESNYPKPGVINYRTVPVDQIQGFGRTGQVSSILKTGPDSSGFGVFGGKKTEDDGLDRLLTLDEQRAYGVGAGSRIRDVQGKTPKEKTEGKSDLQESYKVEKADAVSSAADNVLALVKGGTTGANGLLKSKIPGTQSYNLARRIDTLKANIGFQELSAMRAASPTGGALGNVSEKELLYLQSTLGSLDIGQSEKELRANLQGIKDSIRRWQENQNKYYQQEGGASTSLEEEVPVRNKKTGETGYIQRQDFDSGTYELLQ